MEETHIEGKHTIKPYFITREGFKAAPERLEPYKPEETITRANFSNFLIYSFRISMGQPNVQILFMQWLKLRTGFDYSGTLTNFIQAGGWNILSDNEKMEFKNQFSKVRKHTIKWFEFEWEDEIMSELKATEMRAKKAIEDEDKTYDKIGKFGNLAEFLIFAKEEVELLRAVRAEQDEDVRE